MKTFIKTSIVLVMLLFSCSDDDGAQVGPEGNYELRKEIIGRWEWFGLSVTTRKEFDLTSGCDSVQTFDSQWIRIYPAHYSFNENGTCTQTVECDIDEDLEGGRTKHGSSIYYWTWEIAEDDDGPYVLISSGEKLRIHQGVFTVLIRELKQKYANTVSYRYRKWM